MKYQVGDKVKIKTWEQMEKEFGTGEDLNISCQCIFTQDMEQTLIASGNDRILTIKKVHYHFAHYDVEEVLCFHWSDDMIEGLHEDTKEEIEKMSRFDLMEL